MVKERILETALKMFRIYGVKGVTMFDIARDCGISKKTVYEHFEDKQALVGEGLQQLLTNHGDYLKDNIQTSTNAIEELLNSTRYMTNMAKTLNPVMLHDLQKYHPDIWNNVERFKSDGVLHGIKENLKRGMTEGLYRQTLDINIVARMRQLQLEAAFDPEQYPADLYEMQNVMDQVTAHYILGIATTTGQQMANQFLK
ncbi:TetR/AcrR family transcriptional regulator [Chitinophaga silvatica]|uniref:TetR/AcrR family transcriptional regulator n=1 Tax=Chitinophaga silvatica TaxID=2282649 RepID=A0A3E1YBZ3_9BACT|nr:TetR/AcrR family transcriptional regulator [Chitinophaga silvatica]RFS23520.1 TetR/AcrR family transcriptional regulator [Chitinophaga silvatica]